MTSPSAPATAGPSTTLNREAATKAEIEAAYRQSWDAFVAVASDPNGQVDDARLSERTRGDALSAAKLAIRRLRGDGQVLRVTQLELNPEVVELGPGTAVVEDCAIDVSGIIDGASGVVIVPAGPPEPKLIVATYEFVNGTWMQNGFTDTKQPCAPPES